MHKQQKKILIASDSFKDCLPAKEVGEHLMNGLQRASADYLVKVLPMADGGEGTLEALTDATQGALVKCIVKDPLMRDVEAKFGITGDGNTAIIEMAAASGIELLTIEERNPWHTTSYGTGQLILHALDKGCRRFVCGIGGSATNDGGMGMLKALGVKFLDADNKELGDGGGVLFDIARINTSLLDPRLRQSEFVVACDVTNPLTGEHGASATYGPQKGADADMVKLLDEGLKHYASLVRESLSIEIDTIKGAGAAGGLGAGFLAFLNAKLERGIEIVVRETKLEEQCKWADLVITGEGKIDFQTKFGKTPQGVADVASKFNKPVIGVAGTLGENYQELYSTGFNAILSILDRPITLQEALNKAPELLENTGFLIGQMLKSGLCAKAGV